MSFVRTLATLAVGFAAARGVDKVRKAGGADAVKDAMRNAGEPGGIGDQIGEFAEKMGIPGGRETMRAMMGQMGSTALGATEASEAGMGALLNAMSGAAKAGASGIGDMVGAMAAATPAGAIAEENAKLMIRAMIQAAKADGEIDADERTKILDHLSDASEEEMAFVQAELDAPLDPVALANSATEQTKAQVYSAALIPISVDTDQERQYLATLASALGLEAPKVREIHDQMGKPFL
ncbi:DUF533 domain-containing protein [Aliiroseovarius sp. PTFE2010]|uniref:DUF533 domain-containing protein n=1 Tax=Aliiroseovarius sp. PTFE2010 TaxID=3417190 RepID=UPI003CF11AD5